MCVCAREREGERRTFQKMHVNKRGCEKNDACKREREREREAERKSKRERQQVRRQASQAKQPHKDIHKDCDPLETFDAFRGDQERTESVSVRVCDRQ